MSGAIITEDMMVGAAPQTSTPPPSGTPVPAAPEPVITESQMTGGGFDPHMVTEDMMTGPAPLHTPSLGGPTGSPLISGFAKGFGSEPLSWSSGLSQLLSSTGMTPPNGPGTGTTMQGITQMIEPALGAGATVAELGYRGLSGLLGAGQATVAQMGEDVGQPRAGRDFAAFAEAFPTGFNLGIPRQPTGGMVPYRPAEAAPNASDVFARGAEGIPRQPERPVPAGPDAPFHEPEATQPAPVVTPAPVQPTQPVAPEPMEPPILRPKPAQPIAPVPDPAQVSPATQAPEPLPNANGPNSPGYVPPVAPGPSGLGGSGNAPDPAGQPGQQVVGQPSPAPGGTDGAGPVAPVAPEPLPGPAPVAGQPAPEPTPAGVDANAAPPAAGNGGTGTEGVVDPPGPARGVPGPDDTPVAPGPDPARTAPAGAGPAGEPGQARTETVSTATGRKVDTSWEVVDASQLKPATGNRQPRDRANRASSEAQIENIKSNLDPERLHSSPEADRGAPIVGPDNEIESGHGRIEAIRRAYAQGLPQASAYRTMIEGRGHAIPPGVPEPVLIRRRITPMDDATREAFTREANTPATMQMSAGEEARSDAAALSPGTLGRLNPHLTGGVLAAGNRDFVRSWLSGLSEGERNRLQSEDGSGLSQDGVKRLQSAIIAKAYGDPAVVRRLTESTDDATKAISGALTDVAPLMATVRAKIEAGQLPADLDISKQIMRAADLARVSREKGQTPSDILNSGDMFNPIDRTTGALVRAFHDPKMTRLAGRARVADILKRYAQEALKQTSNDLAGGSKLDPAQYINAAINKAAPETEAQGGLFGGTTKPEPVASPPEPAAGASSESAQPVAGGAGEGSGSSRSPASTPEPNKPVSAAADRMSELAPPGFDPTVRGNISRNTHHTMRPSHYMRQVAEEAGVADPDAFVSLPAPVQVRRLSHALTDKYDLGKITIHPGSNPRLILDQLADAHHNLQSMAAVMGVPNNTIGFGGELNLWLGPTTAKEAEGVYGAYVPATGTIIMPGRSNSFAHEWTHALDTELVRRLSASPRVGELLSTHYPTTLARAQQGPVAAFGHLMGTIYGGPGNARTALDYLQATRQAAIQPTPANQRALAAARQKFQASDFYRRAAGAGGVRGTYLSQPYELLARSHEAYMATRIGEAGGSTEFVAKPETAYLHQVDQNFRSMFPQGDERQAIFQAWDGVHSALRQATLYPKGIPADVATSNDLFGLGPSRWAQWANPAANPALTATLKQELNRQMVQRGWWEEMRERGGLTQNQTDPGYMTWTARKIDGVRIISHSPRGEMNAIHKILTKKAPDAAPHIRSLIDHLTTDPGSGRLIPETYEEEFHRLNHRDLNDYAALVERHGIATSPESNWNPKGLARKAVSLPRMVPSEIDALHELMTGATSIRGLPENIQEALRTHTVNRLSAADKAALDAHWDRADATRAPGATPRIRRFASSLRHYLDKKYYELGQAGIQIPYTDGYWPKVFDEARIRTQPAAFRDDAAKFKAIQSRRDIGDKGEALVERFRALRGTPKNPGPTDPNGTPYLNPQDGDDINRAIAQARRTLQPGQPVRPEDLVPDPDHRALIHEAWGKQAADSWLTNITVGHPTSFETHGPAGGHLQARTLPPESDDILRRWIIKDPHSMMPAYTSQINRRIAYVKRFGPSGHKIEDALRAASRAGMDRDQLDTVRHLAEQITGRNHRSPSFATVRAMSSAIHAWTVMSLLGRASFTALHEPMVALLRTQNVRDTAMGFVQMAREIARTGDAKRIAELAEHIGLTTSPVFESIVQHRMGTGPADSVALNALTTNFFRRILMSQITNAQRRGGLAQGHSYLRRMSDQLLDQDVRDIQRRRAARALTELGIPAAEHQDFARWIQAHPRTQAPGIPDIQDHRNGELWASAIYRFTNQVNQAPTTSEKPIMSDDPYGKMVFGLLNFNYSFQANVLDRALAEAEADFHDAKGFTGKTASAARSAALNLRGAAGLVFASFLGTALVHSLFNGASWDEHERKGDLYEWLMNAAMQRSGLSGTMDPLVQLYHGLRYQKSVGDLGLGIGGFWADNINAVLDGFARSSPHTNTSSYNAYKGVYNLGVVPALTWLMTALPGGLIASPLATTALMKGTSRSAADTFAASIVGEKGSGDETTAPQTEAPERDDPEDEKKPDTGSKEGLLLGFADDFLPMAGRMLGALPAPLKWGAAGLGALYGGYKLHEDAGRYTEPPPGKAER